jgi:hypothetical protein
MMRKIVALAVFLMAMVVSAQGDDAYQLRELDIDDYLTLLDTTVSANEIIDRMEFQAIFDTMQVRKILLEDADYDRLIATYDRLFETVPYLIDHSRWNSAILTSALRENRLTVNNAGVVTFDQYELDVTPIDFDADGTDEYLIKALYRPFDNRTDIIDGDYDAYHIIYMNSAGSLVAASTPLNANYVAMPFWAMGIWEPYPIEDVNDDGELEWVVIEYGDNAGPGGWMRGFLRIFAWRNATFINIAPTNFGFHNDFLGNVSWEWDDMDGDGQIEFIETSGHSNSWGCLYETSRRIDWSFATNAYEYVSEIDTIPQSYGCIITDAETAMWESDYQMAVSLYEQALAIGIQEDTLSYRVSEHQYTQLRLALAYAMTDQIDAARIIINDLGQQTPGSEGIGGLIDSVVAIDLEVANRYELCATMYDYFLSDYGTFDFYVGYTLVDNEMFALYPQSPPNPRNAGCDLNQFISSSLGEAPFLLDDPPLERFNVADIPVQYSLNTDLNRDDIDEWLIYPDAFVDPYFFASDIDSGQYEASRPMLPVSKDFSVTELALPDGEQDILQYISYDVHESSYYPSCLTDVQGAFQLWRFERRQLVPFFTSPLCEPLSASEIVQDEGRSLHLWRTSECVTGSATYVWDGESYIPGDLSCLNGPNYNNHSYDAPEDERPYTFRGQINDLREALVNEVDLEAKTDAVEGFLRGDLSWTLDGDSLQGRYYYALALESLDRPDEALATYVAIYEDTPESAWGMLAALHFEAQANIP